VTASEDQTEAVVSDQAVGWIRHRHLFLQGDKSLQFFLLFLETGTSAQTVHCFVLRRADQPRTRIRRHSFCRPLLQCHDKGFLYYLLGEVEVA
jgi:hypothetical protein